jgi:tetratricopeptide (TPR) repeat protein
LCGIGLVIAAERRGGPVRYSVVLGLIVGSGVMTRWHPTQVSTLAIEAQIARYASGDQAAARDLPAETVTADELTSALDAWIAAGDSQPQRRLTMAVSFALDAVWTATRSYRHQYMVEGDPDRGGRVQNRPVSSSHSQGRIAEWVVKRLARADAEGARERMLWLTAVGIAQDGKTWRRLQEEILPVATSKLPNEPRLRLAVAVSRAYNELGHLRFVPGTIRRNDILRNEPYPPSAKNIEEVIRGFEPLLLEPELAGESHLRIGYLQLRIRRWVDALEHLEAARTTAQEPFLVATANYLTGWIYEHQKRQGDAIEAYRRAIRVAPGTRSVSMRLAALLFLRNDRAESYALLEAAQNADPVPIDPLVGLDIGDGRLVPDWLTAIRGALR